MPYSEVDDLLVGDIPLPRGMKSQKYVDDASDEIDSMIGFVYETPLNMDDDSTIARPVRLLLKRLANNLATGRLILAMSTGGQRMELHAYGAKLVADAISVLTQIASGDLVLQGATRVEPSGDDPNAQFTGPQIANVDAESNVEAFYDRVASPNYSFGFPWGDRRIGGDTGLVR